MSAARWPLRWAEAFLSLGSNVGDRLDSLQRGVDVVGSDARTRVEAVSGVYETDPVGGPEQDRFMNMAARVRTRRSPAGLLRVCHAAEEARGRTRTERWGPRTLDVDVLLYGTRTVVTDRLVIPHPRLAERAFVLVPLAEVGPHARLPDGTPVTVLLERLQPVAGVDPVGARVRLPAGGRG